MVLIIKDKRRIFPHEEMISTSCAISENQIYIYFKFHTTPVEYKTKTYWSRMDQVGVLLQQYDAVARILANNSAAFR